MADTLPPVVAACGCCAARGKVSPSSWKLLSLRLYVPCWFRTREPAAEEDVAEVRTCLRTRSTATSPVSVTGRGRCREIRRDGAESGRWAGQLPGIVVVRPGSTSRSACASCGVALESYTGVGPVGSRRAPSGKGRVPRAAASRGDSSSGSAVSRAGGRGPACGRGGTASEPMNRRAVAAGTEIRLTGRPRSRRPAQVRTRCAMSPSRPDRFSSPFWKTAPGMFGGHCHTAWERADAV